MGQIKNIKLHIVTDIKKMVFTAVQTSAGNVARSHIRTLAMNPPKYNEPYFTADACTRQPLDTEVCLMCHIISHIQQKSKSTTKSDTLHISNLKTPCLAKKSEEVKTDDVSTTETEGEKTEKLIVSLSKDMAEVNPSCVNSEKDALRPTIAEIVNHCCQEWIGARVKVLISKLNFTGSNARREKVPRYSRCLQFTNWCCSSLFPVAVLL